MQNKGSLTQIINHLSRYIIRNALKSRVRMIHKKTGPDQVSNLCDLDRLIQYLVQ